MDEAPMLQQGRLAGPGDTWTEYTLRSDGDEATFRLGNSQPVFASEARAALRIAYEIHEPGGGWRALDSFNDAEKAKLRPIAETLAMLDGNAFFGAECMDGHEWYEQYLPEAAALYDANGGDNGWAGNASFGNTAYARGRADQKRDDLDICRQHFRDDETAQAIAEAIEEDGNGDA